MQNVVLCVNWCSCKELSKKRVGGAGEGDVSHNGIAAKRSMCQTVYAYLVALFLGIFVLNTMSS